MTLAQYLKLREMTDQSFAGLIGVERSTVTRLRSGQIPKKAVMQAIYKETQGLVTANDFYEVTG